VKDEKTGRVTSAQIIKTGVKDVTYIGFDGLLVDKADFNSGIGDLSQMPSNPQYGKR
jgi:hypothetical protein